MSIAIVITCLNAAWWVVLLVIVAHHAVRRHQGTARRAFPRRPDYAAISRMELDIYGETFGHAGAGNSPPAPAGTTLVCEYGHALDARTGRCEGGVIWPPELYKSVPAEQPVSCPPSSWSMGGFQAATASQYATWLNGYIRAGGRPTHFYGYPFRSANFRYATTPVTVDSDREYGTRRRDIIVADGVTTHRTNPAGHFGGWAHTKLYFMHGYRTNASVVPVYSDPEFDAIRRQFPERTRS